MAMINQILSVSLVFITSCSMAATKASVECKISPGSATFKAETDVVNGTAFLNKNLEISAEEISVDLRSLTTSMSMRDDHMKNKYLEVEKFPTATLILGKGKDGLGDGKIKIRGIEKEVTGNYKLVNDNELEATFELNLSEFDIKGIRHLGVGVKDLVKITVVVPYKKIN